MIIVSSRSVMEMESIVDDLFDDDMRRWAARLILSGGIGPETIDGIRHAMSSRFPKAPECGSKHKLDNLLHEVKTRLDSLPAKE